MLFDKRYERIKGFKLLLICFRLEGVWDNVFLFCYLKIIYLNSGKIYSFFSHVDLLNPLISYQRSKTLGYGEKGRYSIQQICLLLTVSVLASFSDLVLDSTAESRKDR